MTTEGARNKVAMWFSGHATQQGVKEVWVVKGRKEGFGKILGVVREFEIGVHLHKTSDEAVAAANAERQRRIESLRKQIEKQQRLIDKDTNTEWVP